MPDDPQPLTIVPDAARAMLVLGHGAGSPASSPLLRGFSEAVVEHGIATYRFDFPYMQAGRRTTDRAPVLIAAYRAAFEEAAAIAGSLPVLAGGRSMGGRIASMAVAEGMPAAALVFLAYPLHPPGRPDRIRDEHLYDLSIPMLFIQGTHDAFAQPDLLQSVLVRLGDRARYAPVEGADHGFRRAGGPRDAATVGASLAPAAVAFVDDVVAART
jgi:predicted alpha/beta-hydrolase family hydrolase